MLISKTTREQTKKAEEKRQVPNSKQSKAISIVQILDDEIFNHLSINQVFAYFFMDKRNIQIIPVCPLGAIYKKFNANDLV